MPSLRFALTITTALACFANLAQGQKQAQTGKQMPSSNDARSGPDYCGRPGCTPGKPYRGKMAPPLPSGGDPLGALESNYPVHRPNALLPSELKPALGALDKRLDRCADRRGFHGRVHLQIRVRKSGRVARVVALGATPKIHRCLQRTVRSARFASRRHLQSFDYSFLIGNQIPESLERRTLVRSLRSLQPQFEECGRRHRFSGIVHARIYLKANGRAGRTTRVKGGSTMIHRCIRRAIRRSRFPRSRTSLTFTYPLRMGPMPAATPQTLVPKAPTSPPPTPPARRVSHPKTPTDIDGDGLQNANDLCPTVAEDVDNFEDGDGCPDNDNDGDHINDTDDQCPGVDGELPSESQENFNGIHDDDGCPDRAR